MAEQIAAESKALMVDPFAWKLPIHEEEAQGPGPFKAFHVRPPVTEGREVQRLASSDVLSCYLRVSTYGERALHAHPDDAVWLVLEGEATFFDGSGQEVARVGKLDGLLVPRGTVYRFESTGAETLAILRVSALPNAPAEA